MAKKRTAVALNDKLTDKQQMFIDAYFICGMNGTEAASQAGYAGDRDVLAVQASRLLSNVKVRARINELLEQFHLGRDEALARLAYMARGSMEDFIDEHTGAIDTLKAKRAHQLHLVKKYKSKVTTFTTKDGNEGEIVETEVELHDAQSAIVNIGKHLGLFQADTNININLTQLSDEELRHIADTGKVIETRALK